jgi:hypothetical protein
VATVQPEGTYRYAGPAVPQPIIQPTWTKKQLRTMFRVFGKRPGIGIYVAGKRLRLAAPICEKGLARGHPPKVGFVSAITTY